MSAARAIIGENARAKALTDLAPLLSGTSQTEVLIESFPIAFSDELKQIMTIWRNNSFAGFEVHFWTSKLRALAQDSRSELLTNLVILLPLIEHLGGQAAIEEFFYALRDVTTWWP